MPWCWELRRLHFRLSGFNSGLMPYTLLDWRSKPHITFLYSEKF